MNFDLPEAAHTDKPATIIYYLDNLYGSNIEWSATKDGEVTKLADILDVILKIKVNLLFSGQGRINPNNLKKIY